jgi:hypothetical protein
MLSSRTEGPSEASLLLFYAKSLATMETVMTAHSAHFFPSVLISHSKKITSNTPCLLTIKRKLVYLLSTTFAAILKTEG